VGWSAAGRCSGGAHPDDEGAILRMIRAGQVQAYASLVTRYQDRVFNTCWRICGNLEDARDLTQEAFLRALERISTFRGESGFYTWIFRVAVNLALSHRRRERRNPVVSLDGLSSPEGDPAAARRGVDPSDGRDPESNAARGDAQRVLIEALNALEPDARAVVVLRDMEGFDYEAIAEVLEIPTGTVKSRLSRARAVLREAIRPHLSAGE
jgi:RNA polymerase sigma-70 factor (ECF subfamily)